MGWDVFEEICLFGIDGSNLAQLRADVTLINSLADRDDTDQCTSRKFPHPMNFGVVSTTYEGYNDVERQLNSDCQCMYHRRRPELDGGILPLVWVGYQYHLDYCDRDRVLTLKFEGYKFGTYDYVDKRSQMAKIARKYGCESVKYSQVDEYGENEFSIHVDGGTNNVISPPSSQAVIVTSDGSTNTVGHDQLVMAQCEANDPVIVTGGDSVGKKGILVCIDGGDAIVKDESGEYVIVDVDQIAKYDVDSESTSESVPESGRNVEGLEEGEGEEEEEEESVVEPSPKKAKVEAKPAEDWSKLTVAKLKEELTKRGLDTKGKKAELVARLDGEGNSIMVFPTMSKVRK